MYKLILFWFRQLIARLKKDTLAQIKVESEFIFAQRKAFLLRWNLDYAEALRKITHVP